MYRDPMNILAQGLWIFFFTGGGDFVASFFLTAIPGMLHLVRPNPVVADYHEQSRRGLHLCDCLF